MLEFLFTHSRAVRTLRLSEKIIYFFMTFNKVFGGFIYGQCFNRENGIMWIRSESLIDMLPWDDNSYRAAILSF